MSQIDTSTLKSTVDLRYLASRYTTLTGGMSTREWYGPCPRCGGDDRFHVTADWFFCREGKGCHPKKGDAIEFMMWLKELDFQAACEALTLGELPLLPAESRPVSPKRNRRPAAPPGPVWQARARDFIAYSQKMLWQPEGQAALDYLKSRGLSQKTITDAGLGFNPHDIYDKPRWWGLADKRTIWLPGPGIVIPWLAGSQVWRINIRLIEPRYRRRKGGDKKLVRYRGPAGFGNGLYNVDALSPDRPAVLVEGELDALTIQQQAGDLVTAIATGSTTGSRRKRWIARLVACPLVLVAFDAEEAGDQAARFWLKALPQAQRLRPHGERDANAMVQAGLDLRAWIQAALPAPFAHPAPTWPLVITWPAGAPVAAVGDQWQRLPDGSIRATYHTIDELRWCLELMRLAREVDLNHNQAGPAFLRTDKPLPVHS